MNQPLNVYESWPLYDTVMIADDENVNKIEGNLYSFKQLGALRDIPFFNIRNRASAGVAYNNFDSKEHLSFAYHCYSIGVQFMAPVNGGKVWTGTVPAWVDDVITGQLFAAELLKHAALELRVSQDQKVENCIMLTPEGSGIGGVQMSSAGPEYSASQSYHNGQNQLSNRWKFAEPIQMPRNVTLQAKIIFSEYARELLSKMGGPYQLGLDPSDSEVVHPAACMMRVSMFGKREVQQRGELHFT